MFNNQVTAVKIGEQHILVVQFLVRLLSNLKDVTRNKLQLLKWLMLANKTSKQLQNSLDLQHV